MKAIVPAWRANSISQNWFNEFDQLFENFFDQKTQNFRGLACDIEESEKFILFSFDLPGMEEKEIQIEIKDSVLQISGERKQETYGQDSHSFRGRQFGVFRQSFRVPKNVDQDKIEADYTNGVLKILLPKNEVARPKKVEVMSKRGNFLKDLLKGKQES